MADQEFSSPGDHMASMSSSSSTGIKSSGVIYAGSRGPGVSNVSYGPPVSNNYNMYRDYVNGFSPRSSRRDDIDDYLGKYLKYNEDMFTRAQDYDMMMSNTAIRRQMEDLKAAGINPILAGRLGGASYKGVSAPYVSINPGSTYASMYTADVGASNVDRQISAELERTNLTNENMLQIARENNLNDKEVASLMTNSNLIQQGMRDAIDTAGHDKSLIGNIISSGLHGLATLAIFASRNGGKGNNSSGYVRVGGNFNTDTADKSSSDDRTNWNEQWKEHAKSYSNSTVFSDSFNINATTIAKETLVTIGTIIAGVAGLSFGVPVLA